MVRIMRRLGVFTVVSFAVFAISVIVNLRYVSQYFRTFTIHVEASTAPMVFAPPLTVASAWVASLLWIIRVYVHCRVVDLSGPMNMRVIPVLERASRNVASSELVIRILLVLGVTLFPSVCRMISSQDENGASPLIVRFYFLVLGLLLVLWDEKLYRPVVKLIFSRDRDPDKARWLNFLALYAWRYSDWLLCTLWGVLFADGLLGWPGEYSLSVVMTCFPLMFAILFGQFVVWGGRMYARFREG